MDSQSTQVDVVSETVESDTTVTRGRFGRVKRVTHSLKKSLMLMGWTTMAAYDESSAQNVYAVAHGADIDDVLSATYTATNEETGDTLHWTNHSASTDALRRTMAKSTPIDGPSTGGQC